MPHRSFTVGEANSLIPRLEKALEEIAGAHEVIQRSRAGISLLKTLWGKDVEDSKNPDFEEYDTHCRALEERAGFIERTIQEEIVDRGLRFPQGGLQYGLVDFPTTYHGRWVYLCWRRGEPEIVYWHEIHAGFGGRTPLTRADASQMGLPDDPALQDDSMLDF
jgi:hypothetical protein